MIAIHRIIAGLDSLLDAAKRDAVTARDDSIRQYAAAVASNLSAMRVSLVALAGTGTVTAAPTETIH